MGIQVPPDSTGKIVETNTPNAGLQRQVVTPGSAGTSNTQVFNTAGQGQVVEQGAPNLSTTQVTIGNTSTQVVGANSTRRAVIITLLGSTPIDTYFGTGSVSTGNGFPLLGLKGAQITIATNGSVYGICASTQSVAVMEVYD
jgi:hypothetical protein